MTESVAVKRAFGAAKYAGLAAIGLALSAASVLGIRPFGAGYCLALVFCGVPFVFAAPVFVLGELLAAPGPATLLYAAIVVLFALLGRILILKFRRGKIGIMTAAALLSQAGLPFGVLWGKINLLQALLWGVFAVGVLFLACGFVRPVLVNKLRYKLLETELISCGILLAAAFLGVAPLHIAAFPVLPMLALPVVLLCGYIGGPSGALVSGVCVGLGCAVSDFSVVPVAAYVFMALVGSVFLSAPRLLSAASVTLAYVTFTFFFNVDYANVLTDFLSLLAGAVLYVLVPRKTLDGFKAWLTASHSGAAARSMINRSKTATGNALTQSARIFEEMSAALSGAEEPVRSFTGQLYKGVCEQCPMLARCAALPGFGEALDKVTRSSTEKGRASVSELPAFLSENCTRLSRLIGCASECAEKNRTALLRAECERSARGIVSEQLGGMAKILARLGEDARRPAQFDRAKERVILEELNYRGVVASEALVSGGTITVIARTETVDRAVTEKAVSRILRAPFTVTGADTDEAAGFTVLSCEKAPHFDVAFACSGVPKRKGDKSGDTHSFIKIGSDKFMMALCDGMGTGEEAEKASETAIGLVESFYKAGFDHELVLSSVNKFLNIGGGERFSALDICVIDLNTGDADLIKFGAPATIVKSKESVRALEGSALPMGVLTEARPSLRTIRLEGGETVVLTSDGVSDSFEEQGLMNAVNNLRTQNPTILAGGILEHTLAASSGIPRDDSTVLCARLFERV